MKPGDKFRNMISGNEGTIQLSTGLEPSSDAVAVKYNSPAYGDSEIVTYPDRSTLIKIPHFKQQEGDDVNAIRYAAAWFPPGARAVHKYSGLGTVSSALIKGYGTEGNGMVYFQPDSEPSVEFPVYVPLLTLDYAEPVKGNPQKEEDDVSSDDGIGHSAFTAIMPPAESSEFSRGKLVGRQLQMEDDRVNRSEEKTRTNQLLNELYHDRARLEKVVADAAQVIETLGSAIERVTDAADFAYLAKDQYGALEYGNWLLGIAQQFVDSHGEKE